MTLDELIKNKKVIICCGSGGVGKTTTSAAIALWASCQGLKTIVLTIDPAKRLANSLGVKKIDFQEKEITKKTFLSAGLTPKAPLYAMMLDTKRTFDSVIEKYASTPEQAQSILGNKLYQHLSTMMAGSQEYMAMEKLYEIIQERDYDLVILDTPPSRHALDFLDAPQKMSQMIGDSIMKWFLKPSLFVSRKSLGLLDKSVKRVFKSFDKVAGFEFLQDLSGMLVATSGLLGGFQERAEKVQELLHNDQTSFLLIASPQPIPLQEAEFFYEKILEYKLPFAGFIFNRVQMLPTECEGELKKVSDQARIEYAELRKIFFNLHRRDSEELKSFREKMRLKNDDLIYHTLPQLDHDIHDLTSLHELGELIFA